MANDSERVAAYRAAFAGATPLGGLAPPSELSTAELGALAPLAFGPADDVVAALSDSLRDEIFERGVELDPPVGLAAIVALCERVSLAGERELGGFRGLWVRAALVTVRGSMGGVTEDMSSALTRLAECTGGDVRSAVHAAFMALAGKATTPVAFTGPWASREFAFMAALERLEDRLVLAAAMDSWAFVGGETAPSRWGADAVALLPGYLAFARELARHAVEHAEAIQRGDLPFAADKAFTTEAAGVLQRVFVAGLDQDEPWARDAIIPFFRAVAIAPVPKKKSAPSQSASIAIAKAVAERPTFALLEELREAIADVRHAGLKKKCGGILKTGERRFRETDEFLLGVSAKTSTKPKMAGAIAKALEAFMVKGGAIDTDHFVDVFLADRTRAKLATALVWADDAGLFLPVKRKGRWLAQDIDGKERAIDGERVRIAHLVEHASEAEAWRAHVLEASLEQPFNQLFRETYDESSFARFAGVLVSRKVLMGLGRSEGWRVDSNHAMSRKIGTARVTLGVEWTRAGGEETTRTTGVTLDDDVAPREVSESARAVDLLVSVAAFGAAKDAGAAHLGSTAHERRRVLVRLFGEVPRDDGPHVDGRRVRIGDAAIHIATGRAERAGEELEMPEADDVVALPYPDATMRRIVALSEMLSR